MVWSSRKNGRECLQWWGQLARLEESAWPKRNFKVSGRLPRGQPRKLWNDIIRSILKERKGKSART